jgi:hypothetical protein
LKEYLETNGRDSGRKDLLSKIISNKTDTGDPPLTDLETSMEIGNLVFAGSGKLFNITAKSEMMHADMFWQIQRV